MHKLIKHGLMLEYRYILGNIAIMALVTIASLILVPDYFMDTAASIVMFICIISVIVAFFNSMAIFSKGVRKDTKYFLHSIPQEGYSFLGSQLVVGITQFVTVTFFAGIFMLIIFMDVAVKNDGIAIGEYFGILGRYFPQLLFGAFFAVLICGGGALHMFFSQVLVKAALGHRKFKGIMTLLVFGSLIIMESVIGNFIAGIFQYEVYFKTVSLEMDSDRIFNMLRGGNVTRLSSLNVAEAIFFIVFWIGLFIGAAYMLDKEMDI